MQADTSAKRLPVRLGCRRTRHDVVHEIIRQCVLRVVSPASGDEPAKRILAIPAVVCDALGRCQRRFLMVLYGTLKSHGFSQTVASTAFERFDAVIRIMMLKKCTSSLGKATTTESHNNVWVPPRGWKLPASGIEVKP